MARYPYPSRNYGCAAVLSCSRVAGLIVRFHTRWIYYYALCYVTGSAALRIRAGSLHVSHFFLLVRIM